MANEQQTAFISYSREDSEFALRLAEDLKAAGAAVWLDQLDIQPGQRWARAVQDALNDCPRMLVILSPSSVDSTNVEDEVSFALEEKKTVIPVLYRECKIPFRLRPLQHLDFRTDYPRGLQGLLKTGAVTMAVVPAPAPGIVTSVPEGRGSIRQRRIHRRNGLRSQQFARLNLPRRWHRHLLPNRSRARRYPAGGNRSAVPANTLWPLHLSHRSQAGRSATEAPSCTPTTEVVPGDPNPVAPNPVRGRSHLSRHCQAWW